jgi:DNA-binding FrmR family transcriptional regulator
MSNHQTTHESQIPRLNRIEGQVRGITRMIEEDRYCVDILTQLRSVLNALHKVQENIFRHHLETCVNESLHGDNVGDREAKIEEILDLVSKFRKP